MFASAISAAVVSNAPAARNPCPTSPTSVATASARSPGDMLAVASSYEPGTGGASAGGARPGNWGSGTATRANSSALAAARAAPSFVKSFEAAIPSRPSFTTRTRSAVSSRHVL